MPAIQAQLANRFVHGLEGYGVEKGGMVTIA
jgi:hypothetical protein